MTEDPKINLERRNRRTALAVLSVVAVMTILAFASVPLYNMFCRVTGFAGTTQVAQAAPAADKILPRTVEVRFDAGVARDLPWRFGPGQRAVTVRLGEKKRISYNVKNLSREDITGTAIHNVAPAKAGKYFRKIECFCFGEQPLKAGQAEVLPVLFFIDPAMDKDPDMQDLKTVTLSYTFFRAESPALDKAMEDFYNHTAARAAPKKPTQTQ